MIDDHWFDMLNKLLVRDAPRRTVLGAAALVASLARGGPVAEAAKKGKKGKNGKKKRKKKAKPPPKPARSCDGGECAQFWEGDDDAIAFCEAECKRCQQAGTAFCSTHLPDEEHPDFYPTCCPRGEMCCDFECCAADRCCDGEARRVCCDLDETCCDPGAGRERVCVGIEEECCPDDFERGYCSADQRCCTGYGCVARTEECPCLDLLRAETRASGRAAADDECPNDCDESCVGPDRECCNGECVNITNDADHCGGCGLRCVDHNRPDCCDRQCVNTEFCRAHCGVCNHHCEDNEGCVRGVCRCTEPCCTRFTAGVCTGAVACCPEPCSRCTPSTCLEFNGVFCVDQVYECQVVQEYCPNVPGPNVCDDYDCCGFFPVMETCTATGCERA